MGNATITKVFEGVVGNRKRSLLQVTMSNSYATGGDSASIENNVGFENIEAIILHQPAIYSVKYDEANQKVIAYDAGGTEVVAATDLSSVSFYCEVYGW